MKYFANMLVLAAVLFLVLTIGGVVNKTNEFNSDTDNISPEVKASSQDLSFLEIPDDYQIGEYLEYESKYYIDSSPSLYAASDLKPGLYTIEFADDNQYCISAKIRYLKAENQNIDINFCEKISEKTTNQLVNVYLGPELAVEINNIFKQKDDGKLREVLAESSHHHSDLRINLNFIPQTELIELNLDQPTPGIYPVNEGTYNIKTEQQSSYYVIDDGILKVYDSQTNPNAIDEDITRVPDQYQLEANQGDMIIILNEGITIEV